MLASKLIEELQYFMERYGDREVVTDPSGAPVRGVYLDSDDHDDTVLVVE